MMTSEVIGYYLVAAFPEDNENNLLGSEVVYRFLATFTLEQESEMEVFIKNWLDEHYPDGWRRSMQPNDPHFYGVTSKRGSIFMGLRVQSVKKDNPQHMEEWARVRK